MNKKHTLVLNHKQSTTLELALLARLRELTETHKGGWKILDRDCELKRILDLLSIIHDEKGDLNYFRQRIENLLLDNKTKEWLR